MKILTVGEQLFHMDRQTNGRTEAYNGSPKFSESA